MRTSTKVRFGSVIFLVTAAIINSGTTGSSTAVDPTDHLVITGIEDGETVYAVIDGPGFGDSILNVHHTASSLGQLAGSHGSIFIVSDRHRPAFVGNIPWTEVSERVVVGLEPYDTLSISAHILTDRIEDARRRLDEQISLTNRLFTAEKSGLTFRVDTVTIAPARMDIPIQTTRMFATRFADACIASPAQLERHFFFPGTINIYYVDQVSTREHLAWKHNLSANERNVLIGIPVSLDVPSILAHELGHALGLRHPDASSDPRKAFMATPANIMHDRSNTRSFFSDGQIFRMNFGVGSAIRTVYRRQRPYVDCGDDSRPSDCPEIFLDIWGDPYPISPGDIDPASAHNSR